MTQRGLRYSSRRQVPFPNLTNQRNHSFIHSFNKYLLSSHHVPHGEGNGNPTLAWKIPRREEVGRLQSPWVAKSRARLSDFTFTFHFHALEKETATHSSVLAWRIPGTDEPSGLPSMRSHRVGHD